jgi:cellulose synthase/poly-beta-1,6-N-acetylglucosamine synthase-like glycosyltransferase
MSRFEDSLAGYGPRLQQEFQSIRRKLSDSDVKGSQNERALTEFLRQHVPSDFIANTAQMLDARDQQSDEIDIVVCNDYQVFREPANGLFIAEGVDFVVQVKAQHTTQELERIFKNSATVKRLERTSAGAWRIPAGLGGGRDGSAPRSRK